MDVTEEVVSSWGPQLVNVIDQANARLEEARTLQRNIQDQGAIDD